MKTSDFEKELQAIDPRLVIVPNVNRPGLSNIKLDGRDICPVPSEEIRENPDNNYRYEMPNGMMPRHNSRQEALSKVDAVLKFIATEEGHDTFFNRD